MQKTKRIVKRIYISLQWSFHTCEDEPVVREKKLLSSVLFPVRPSLSSLFYSPHITRLLTTSNSSLLSSYCFVTLSRSLPSTNPALPRQHISLSILWTVCVCVASLLCLPISTLTPSSLPHNTAAAGCIVDSSLVPTLTQFTE